MDNSWREKYLSYQEIDKLPVKALKQNKTKKALKTEMVFDFGKKMFASGGKGGQDFIMNPTVLLIFLKPSACISFNSRVHKFKALH